MAKERVTLLIHADLARDVERLNGDAVENLSISVEPNIRKWLRFHRPKDTRQHGAEHQVSKTETSRRITARTAKRQKQREFGVLLRETRFKLQLSAEEFARKADWEHSFLNSIEAGRCQLSIERLHKMAHSLALSPEQIHILEYKLKELAQFLLSKTLLKQTQAEAVPNPADETQTKATEGDTNNSCAQSLSKFRAWKLEIPTPPTLTALTSAILESVGASIEKENIDDLDFVEHHPHVLDDCLRKELNQQEASVRIADATVEQDTKIELFFVALGSYIKTRRCELKLKRRELAAKADLESRIVARVEGGKNISAPDMFKIALALELDPGQLANEAQKLLLDQSN